MAIFVSATKITAKFARIAQKDCSFLMGNENGTPLPHVQ